MFLGSHVMRHPTVMMMTRRIGGLGGWTIRRRLAIGFGATIVLLLATTTIGVVMLRNSHARMKAEMQAMEQLHRDMSDTSAASHRAMEATAHDVQQIDDASRTQQFTLAGLSVVGVAIALLFGIATWRAVARPLEQLTETARRLGAGDLRVEDIDEKLDAEYRTLADAFVDTSTRLAALLREIQVQADDVTASARSLTSATEEVAHATTQISNAMGGIAGAASGQLHALGSSREVLDHAADAAVKLTATAERSTELGTDIQNTAVRAQQDIGRALGTLQRAREIIQASATGVSKLEDTSRAVETFVTAIQEVADMTNLISLNAAIEAARVGEQGQGFAVVANEVRDLATRSATAAEDVSVVVETMRREVRAAVASFEEGVRDLGNVDGVSRTATDSLERIQQAVIDLGDVARSLDTAAVANHN